MKKRICIVTGTRAEYGLFLPILKKIKIDPFFELQIIATGMHLSPEFGLTYKEIENDAFNIDEKVEMLLSSDTGTGILKSIGLGIIGMSDALKRLTPDLIVVLGDRYETFSVVTAAFISGIPIAHLYGGETTEGSFDEGLRHSITKMSYFHFVSTEIYRRRVIQLGESPDRVFNVGAVGIDNIKDMKLLNQKQLEEKLNLTFGKKNALVTFHPVTLEQNTAEMQIQNLFNALLEIEDLNIIITKPNSDTGGRALIKMIDEFAAKHKHRVYAYVSLGQLNYLSLIKQVDVVAGNSSSGIVEVPSFRKPTVNIGDRQKGRIRAESVIDCEVNKESILFALQKALSSEFKIVCENVINPYGDGTTSKRIVDIIKKKITKSIDLKKSFFDVDFK